jgi:hypothetical protein
MEVEGANLAEPLGAVLALERLLGGVREPFFSIIIIIVINGYDFVKLVVTEMILPLERFVAYVAVEWPK